MKYFKYFSLIFIILFNIANAQVVNSSYPLATLSSPRDTMNYFLKTMKGFKMGDSQAIDLAIKALHLKNFEEDTRIPMGRLAARQLINTLDRIEYINVQNIPEKLASERWTFRQSIIETDDQTHQVEISIAKDEDGKWRFSKETVATISFYEKFLRKQKVAKGVVELADWKTRFKSKMPEWTGRKSFILYNGQWLAILLLIFFGIITEKIVRAYIGHITTRLLAKYAVDFSLEKQNRFTLPIGVAAFSGFWTLGVRLLEFDSQLLSIFLRIGYIGFTVGCVITAHHLVDVFCLYLKQLAVESDNKFDDILVPLVGKTLKFFVLSIGIIFIGDSLTLDMKSIIAGLGIGGIAFALAAKDTLSNLFGSLTVLLDKPFRIGDWIVIDGSIEGTVQEVGLRSTRIRTFYDSLITVPNGRLTNVHIDNYGQRIYRRLSTKIGVQYDTPPELIESFCEGIRTLIKNHKFTRKDNFQVYFNEFADCSLNILIYVFWKVPDWSSELNEKHRLLIDILRLGNEMGVNFAFPTQTLHVYQEQKTPSEDAIDFEQSIKEAKRMGLEFSEHSLTPSNPRSNINQLD